MPEKIIIPAYLRDSLYKKNWQVDSLERLPEPLRRQVLARQKEILVFHQGKLFRGFLGETEKGLVEIFFPGPFPEIKEGENLVVIVATPQERYVFQGPVREVAERRVRMEILPPRREERFVIPREEVVFLSFIPRVVFEPLFAGRYFLLRDTNISHETAARIQKGYVYDLIIDQEETIVEEFSKILKSSGTVTILKDFSRGGACVFARKVLSLSEEPPVVYIRGSLKGREEKGFNLGLVGLCRQLRVEENFTYFHLRWLQRLPEEVYAFFKTLFL